MLRYLVAAAIALNAFAAASQEKVRLVIGATGYAMVGQIIAYDGLNYRFRSGLGELLVNASFVNCVGEGCPGRGRPGGEFGIHGSNTVGAALMPSLIEAYAQGEGGFVERALTSDPVHSRLIVFNQSGDVELATVDLWAEGSSTSYPALLEGKALIGMSSRRVKDKEVASFVDAGIGPINRPGREHVVALDGLIVIVAKDSAITQVSLRDVAAIFAGQITNWSEVGGVDAPINLYARDELSGTWDTFNSLVLKPQKVKLAPNAQRFQSNARLSDAVAADPNGIGFTGFAYERNARALSLETNCGLVIPPSDFGVKTEEYPLARRLYLYTTGQNMPGAAAAILVYALSDEAQPVISEVGFIDQSVKPGEPGGESQRIARAIRRAEAAHEKVLMRSLQYELADARRLSPTLRFESATGDLDVKSLNDVLRLARFAAAAIGPDEELVLAGYADPTAPPLEALEDSLRRSERIASMLNRDLSFLGASERVRVTPLAFGSLAPVACSDTDSGRASNTRVEIWVRKRRQ